MVLTPPCSWWNTRKVFHFFERSAVNQCEIAHHARLNCRRQYRGHKTHSPPEPVTERHTPITSRFRRNPPQHNQKRSKEATKTKPNTHTHTETIKHSHKTKDTHYQNTKWQIKNRLGIWFYVVFIQISETINICAPYAYSWITKVEKKLCFLFVNSAVASFALQKLALFGAQLCHIRVSKIHARNLCAHINGYYENWNARQAKYSIFIRYFRSNHSPFEPITCRM